MTNNTESLALHFKYCALIAVMLLVFLATERWSATKDFTTYLSNAATMTSLLLGVVAIFYSFISNDGMSRSLGSINTVASEVREVREDIQNFAEQTKISTEAASTNNTIVRAASSELSGTMISLSETLGAISLQNETLKELVASLPGRIDLLETKFEDVAKSLTEKPQQFQAPISTTDIPNNAVERFLDRATFQQHMLVIACVIAFQKNKALDIPALCKAIEWNGPSSFVGFLGCMHAVQLCSRATVSVQDKTYTILSVHNELKLNARSSFVNSVDSSFSDKPEDKAKWTGRLAALEVLFT